MYIIVIAIVVVIGLYFLFKRGGEFSEQIEILERDVVFITGDDVARYMDWLLCESIRKLPDISTYDKASAVCMSMRKAAERNNSYDFLAHLDANYKEFHSGAMEEIRNLMTKRSCA